MCQPLSLPLSRALTLHTLFPPTFSLPFCPPEQEEQWRQIGEGHPTTTIYLRQSFHSWPRGCSWGKPCQLHFESSHHWVVSNTFRVRWREDREDWIIMFLIRLEKLRWVWGVGFWSPVHPTLPNFQSLSHQPTSQPKTQFIFLWVSEILLHVLSETAPHLDFLLNWPWLSWQCE